MKTNHILLSAAGLLGVLLMPSAAQAQAPYPHPTSLHQRFQDQHSRIKQGVADGQLTRREARGDRYRLNRVRSQDQRDRFFQGGHLTAGQRSHQTRELNRNSGDIYRTNHNNRVR